MKICVIGTHGVGKTTFCERLKKDFESCNNSVCMLSDTIRENSTGMNFTFSVDQALINYATQIKKEVQAEDKAHVLICDRSIIDSFMYVKAVRRNSYELEACKVAAKAWMRSYSVIVYITSRETEVGGDGGPWLDFRRLVEEEFTEWLLRSDDRYALTIVSSSEVFKGDEGYALEVINSVDDDDDDDEEEEGDG